MKKSFIEVTEEITEGLKSHGFYVESNLKKDIDEELTGDNLDDTYEVLTFTLTNIGLSGIWAVITAEEIRHEVDNQE